MQSTIAVIAVVVMAIGVLGTLIPVLPGVPLVWVVAFAYGWYEGFSRLTAGYLTVMALLAALAMIGEHYARAWGTRRFGGSPAGAWGAVIGSIIGLFFLPIGLLVGPFVGAVMGELFQGRSAETALRSGIGSLLGVLAGTAGNFAVAMVIFVTALFRIF